MRSEPSAHESEPDGGHGLDAALLSRRQVLTTGACVAAAAVVGVTISGCGDSGSGSSASTQANASDATAVPPATTKRPDTPQEAYEALRAGNERFATGQPLHPNQGVELRESTAEDQNPFIGVLACADSRVVPELIFDQGISDVFDVRVAGNIADPASVASLVYAVEVLGVDLVTVMGHSSCGAVKAAIDVSMGKLEAGEFAPLVDAIEPAVDAAMPTSHSGEQLQKTIEENARIQAEALTSSSPALAEAVQAGRLTIVPTVYDLASGRVRILS